jgi:hypothetical protein
MTVQQRTNATAKAKEDLIERRLVLFAVFTFFAQVLIAVVLVSKNNIWLGDAKVQEYCGIIDLSLFERNFIYLVNMKTL